MKSFFLILASLWVLTACTVPGPSDFESAEKPMAEDEFIAMWRFPAKGFFNETLDRSEEHLANLEAAMEPLFQQLIPRIFQDAKNGKLKIREGEDVTDLEEKVIEDLPSRMSRRLDADWQNLAPFMGAFHLTQRRKADTKGFPTHELELSIIEKDPEGKLPEMVLGSVKVEDLIELDYSITVDGQTHGLVAYLNKHLKFGYPIYFRSHKLDQGLMSLKEAFEMKELVLNGKWASVQWLGDGMQLGARPNLTGFKMESLLGEELNTFTGNYVFDSDQEVFQTKNGESAQVTFEVEKEYLIQKWAGETPIFGNELFPISQDNFFTAFGDQIMFRQKGDGPIQVIVRKPNGKETIGYKN